MIDLSLLDRGVVDLHLLRLVCDEVVLGGRLFLHASRIQAPLFALAGVPLLISVARVLSLERHVVTRRVRFLLNEGLLEAGIALLPILQV